MEFEPGAVCRFRVLGESVWTERGQEQLPVHINDENPLDISFAALATRRLVSFVREGVHALCADHVPGDARRRVAIPDCSKQLQHFVI